jgi:hypothetical protein
VYATFNAVSCASAQKLLDLDGLLSAICLTS